MVDIAGFLLFASQGEPHPAKRRTISKIVAVEVEK